MKKLFSLFALTSLLFASSCSEDAIMEPANSGEATVTFSAELPNSINSRAYSDGTTAKHLDYAVYVSGKEGDPQITGSTTFDDNLKATVSLTLATGVSYDFIFWATDGSKDAAYNVNWATKTMTVDYDLLKANDESNDAFYHYEGALHVQGAVTKPIKLYRPFAQINLGTDDFDKAAAAGLTVDSSSMVMTDVPNVLNFKDGTVSGNATVTLAKNEFTTTEAFPVTGYQYLEMNYVLAGAQKSASHTCTFSIYKQGATVALNPDVVVSNVPVQRNFRTNIYGSLLTDPATFNVEIIPDYEGKENIEVVTKAADVLEIAANGGVITLGEDIELASNLVIPAGKDVVINLEDNELNFTKGRNITVAEGSKLTVQGGTLVTTELAQSTYAMIEIEADGEVELNGVELSSNAIGVYVCSSEGAESSCKITDSVITAGTYCISTNASEKGQMHTIECSGTTFNGMSTILLNVPCDATFTNCEINGTFHGVIVRGGTATFDGCTITYTRNSDQFLTYFEGIDWASGNTVNLAALTMGNKISAGKINSYNYPTNVTLKDTDIVLAGTHGEQYPAVYAWANQDEGMGVTFTYDEQCTFGGATIYGSDNIVVNGVPTKTE